VKWTLSGVGLGFIVLAFLHQGAWWLAAWLGGNLVALGIAHGLHAHRLFGKRSNGTLPVTTSMLFLPLHLLSIFIWKLGALLGRKAAWHSVQPSLIVGRRLGSREIVDPCERYVDLTAEFSEPQSFRSLPGYLSFPILDGGAPSAAALLELVRSLRSDRTYVHCAAGHGRTGLVALALLMHRHFIANADEGLRLLQAARPGIRLNAAQRACIDEFSRLLT
jgi:hypothetical protein